MPRFAANLTFLWPDVDDPFERFALAAAAGFRLVERLFVHDLDVGELAGTLRRYELELVLFDPAAGDWDAGERGLLCLPDRDDEAADAVRRGIEHARALGTRRLNVLAGIPLPESDRADSMSIAASRLRAL